uniref:Uncharacterized protein n=1 Tax=Strongyloides venezuelensis TaxID=75913 RepID=A0A0K0FQ37_STRVS
MEYIERKKHTNTKELIAIKEGVTQIINKGENNKNIEVKYTPTPQLKCLQLKEEEEISVKNEVDYDSKLKPSLPRKVKEKILSKLRKIYPFFLLTTKVDKLNCYVYK